MSDWEADDFDCTSQVTDKLVALGLDAALKKDNHAEPQGEDLTEKQKLALQMQSDANIGLELLGIEPEKTKSWNDMRKKADFVEYAEELGEFISSNIEHPQYLFFVNSLLQHICKPMTKLQLETVQGTISGYINELIKKEDEKKKQLQQKVNAKTKKAKKKQLQEDAIEDEYDDLDEKFYA